MGTRKDRVRQERRLNERERKEKKEEKCGKWKARGEERFRDLSYLSMN